MWIFFQRCLSMKCVFFPPIRAIITTCRLNDTPEGLCAWRTLRGGCTIFIPIFLLIQTQRPIERKIKAEKNKFWMHLESVPRIPVSINDTHMHFLLSSWGTTLVEVWVRQELLQRYHSRSAMELKTKPTKPKQNKTPLPSLWRVEIVFF